MQYHQGHFQSPEQKKKRKGIQMNMTSFSILFSENKENEYCMEGLGWTNENGGDSWQHSCPMLT